MGLDEAPGSADVDRLNDLCADLGATVGDGRVLAWANACEPAAVPDVVFGVISSSGLLDDRGPAHWNPAMRPGQRTIGVPADADALWSLLWEVDEPTAIDLLAYLAAGGQPGLLGRGRLPRRYQDQPRDVFRKLADLAGPGTRWWTNTDLTRWNPITQHTFDAVVVCAGNGIAVTLVACAGGD